MAEVVSTVEIPLFGAQKKPLSPFAPVQHWPIAAVVGT